MKPTKKDWAYQNALKNKILIRPKVCSECGKECKPDGHHSNYGELLNVVWLCRSCHAKKGSGIGEMPCGKVIRIDKKTFELLRLEAVRQSMRPNTVVSIGEAVRRFAKKLKKK